MQNWEEVVSLACALPDVTMAPFYGTPCPKLNGKALVSPGREDGSFCLLTSSVDEKLMLIETAPAVFWQTDHYRNSAAVLVRYGSANRERIEIYIRRRWWDCATKSQRRGFGARP